MSAHGKIKLEGVIPALITPLDERGEIDFHLLEKQAAYLSSSGVHGFFVGGTTSEGAYLSTEEKRAIYKIIREVSRGRQFLCLACIKPSTGMVLEEMKVLADLEPDFFVSVTPFYMAALQEDIIFHFREIAKIAGAPLILYNIPSCTHNPMNLDSILELASAENIVGIKDSSGDFVSFSRGVLKRTPDGISWIQGEDYLDGPSMLMGCQGLVTGLGNVRIEPYIDMYQAARAGNDEKVRECQRRINQLYGIIRECKGKVNPAVKAGAAFYRRGSRWMRIRSMTLSEEEATRVEKVLRDLDWA